MNDSSPEKCKIEYLEALEEFLSKEWQSTRDPETKAVVEEIAMKIKLRRALE